MMRLFVASTAIAAAISAAGGVQWADELWLARGGEWTARAEVCASNATDAAWKAETVPVRVATGSLPIGGVGINELRVVDGGGAEIEFGVYDGGGNFVWEGKVPSDGVFALPATAAAGGVARFHVYWGNPRAWKIADAWRKKPRKSIGAVVTVGAVERRELAVVGADAPWPKDGGWEYRVPVRFRNPHEAPIDSAMGAFDAAEALHATRNPEFMLSFCGEQVPCVRVGEQLFFFLAAPAKSICVAYLYVKNGKARAGAAGPVANFTGSEIPSDQQSQMNSVLDDATRKAFRRVFEQEGRCLLKNPDFSQGLAGWSGPGSQKGVKIAAVPGGLFGGRHSVLTVTGEAQKGGWRGLVQTVDVEPGREYVYGAFVKGRDVSAKATVHLHMLDAEGRMPMGADGKRAMLATNVRTFRTGTFGWTPIFGKVRIPANIRKISMHLTMNGTGELSHDGAVIATCCDTGLCDPESASRAAGDFAVCAVSPIVKVFPEFRVKDMKSPFTLALARNETEDLQLAVESGSDGDVSFEVDPPRNEHGEALCVVPGVVTCVPVDFPSSYYSRTTDEEFLRTPNHGSSCDGWAGMWPDPVERLASFRIVANETKAVRISVSAGEGARPGTYSGSIRWRKGGREIRRDAFHVKVWGFAIPKRPEFAAIYDIRLNRDAWRASGEKGNDAARKRVLDMMAEYSICPDMVSASPAFKRAKDGSVTADFTEYDRAATEFFDAYRFPKSYMPQVFYCFGWGHPPKDFLGEAPYPGKRPFTDVDRSKLRPEYRRVYQDALRLYWAHMKEKGWADKLVLYISDEPYFTEKRIRDQMIALCDMIHEVDANIRIYCSTWRHCPEWDNALDVWGVGGYGCFPTNEMVRLSGAGKGIWFTTDGQQCLDTPWCAIERMQPMYAWAYGAEAYEFWGCTWLTYDPWKYGWHSFIRQIGSPEKGASWVRYPNGDGYHIYPPRPGAEDPSPVPSLRLCAIRDGVDEFAYLKRLESVAADGKIASAMREEARRILADYRALLGIPNAGGRYSSSILPEPEVLDRLRERAGSLLNRALLKLRMPRD